MSRQCQLAGLPRSTWYYVPVATESPENLRLMRRIDKLYLARPFYGSPRITHWLRELGEEVNEKRVARLMRLMRLQAVVPGPHTSRPHPEHKVYPYLLRKLAIIRPNQVWATDITYVGVSAGYLYLVAVMDWFSRYVLSWELSASLETAFCVAALQRALGVAVPGIFNSDQGSQFSSEDFTGPLLRLGVKVSMDGRGRAFDNIFLERLWRTWKYEEIHIHDYADGTDARTRLASYIRFYNHERPHTSLDWRTPAEVYFGSRVRRSRPELQLS